MLSHSNARLDMAGMCGYNLMLCEHTMVQVDNLWSHLGQGTSFTNNSAQLKSYYTRLHYGEA